MAFLTRQAISGVRVTPQRSRSGLNHVSRHLTQSGSDCPHTPAAQTWMLWIGANVRFPMPAPLAFSTVGLNDLNLQWVRRARQQLQLRDVEQLAQGFQV